MTVQEGKQELSCTTYLRSELREETLFNYWNCLNSMEKVGGIHCQGT